MTWKPAHGAHAIDRVRLIIRFDDPIPDKVLQRAVAPTTDRFKELGFDSLSRAETSVMNFVVGPEGAQRPKGPENGWVLRRGADIEEAGLRDGVFGYVSTEYGRWENLFSRFRDVFGGPLSEVLNSVNAEVVKLEYWDRFVFDGIPEEADASQLLTDIDPALNDSAVKGHSAWHSYSGWFEDFFEGKCLVNKNYDFVDELIDGENRRVGKVRTLTEYRPGPTLDTLDQIYAILSELHRRSVLIFASGIDVHSQKQIGIDFEEYK